MSQAVKERDPAILYVEDDPVTRTKITKIIERRYTDLRVAENGRQGLDLFFDSPADLVVSDIRMPLMDGLEMSRAMRQMAPHVKIIATTAHSETSYLLEAIESGIDHYVLKPIDLDKFLAALSRCAEDILSRKMVEAYRREQEKLLNELQEAAEEIKLLQGILPICSYCKNIRNDAGYWERVEEYFSRFTKTRFSHSICPECAKKHFPQFFGEQE